MPDFVKRHKAGLLLGGVFLVAWLIALAASRGDRPGPEDPDRWVQGPPALAR